MPALEATYQFQPQMSIDYDAEQKLYIGSLYIRGLTYEFKGIDTTSVERQMEDALQLEYNAFSRSIDPEAKEKARGRSLGGDSDREERPAPKPIEKELADFKIRQKTIEIERSLASEAQDFGRGISAVWRGVEYGHTLQALISGNFLDIFISLILSLGLSELIFVAFVGGEKVRANSRRQLYKLIMLRRNKNIQKIMENVREHDRIKRLIIESSNRLKRKKSQAIILGKQSWEHRVSKGRPRTDWQGRVGDLQRQIHNSRMKSRDLWAGGQ